MNRYEWKQVLAVIVVLTLAATTLWAGGEAEAPTVAAKKYVVDPTNGKVVVASEYGGTLTNANQADIHATDQSISGMGAGFVASGVVEKLGMANWGIDRSVNALANEFLDTTHYAGALAESWEVPNNLTYIFHIQQISELRR